MLALDQRQVLLLVQEKAESGCQMSRSSGSGTSVPDNLAFPGMPELAGTQESAETQELDGSSECLASGGHAGKLAFAGKPALVGSLELGGIPAGAARSKGKHLLQGRSACQP